MAGVSRDLVLAGKKAFFKEHTAKAILGILVFICLASIASASPSKKVLENFTLSYPDAKEIVWSDVRIIMRFALRMIT